jgi:hypothetical protein
MANYLDDNELFYEIVLSKGRGFLTKKAERMLVLIGENMIRRKNNMYKTQDDKNDCLQTGLLYMFEKWDNFNEKKYKLALPYFSEVFKRGMAQGYNDLINKKTNQEKVVMISLDSCNDGEGFHNI